MAGIYIHIPFCKQACHYCDFHFSTSGILIAPVLDAIAKEAIIRKNELAGETIHTVYFGGGTPSILPVEKLQELMDVLGQNYEISPDAEVTLEANPDDLTFEKLRELKSIGINRLSIGIQSFNDTYLQWMNRAHNAAESLQCVSLAHEVGFKNISIDLIYGLPGLTTADWEAELDRAVALGTDHISAYCLTVESGTALGHQVKKGMEKPVDEDAAASQFDRMINRLEQAGFEQYEVSNFARQGKYSRHNTNYWKGIPYLGLGPSAHGYSGAQRSWNIANNAAYVKSLASGTPPLTIETLSEEDQFNEWVMTGLRTKWGIQLSTAIKIYNFDIQKFYGSKIDKLILEGHAQIDDDRLTLTKSGRFLADGIASDFFILDFHVYRTQP